MATLPFVPDSSHMMNPWYHLENESTIPSPALLLFEDRIEQNLAKMLAIAGGPERLRPHVKTHKLAPLVQRQMELGITKFKCSTLAEAEMCAATGSPDVLLAMPCAGPANASRLARLAKNFPSVQFSTVVDDEETVRFLAAAAQQNNVTLGVFIDINCGMGRTGIAPSNQARMLVSNVRDTPRLQFAGVHAYDGHLHQHNPIERREACEAAFQSVTDWITELNGSGLVVREFVCGGSPTFAIHAAIPGRVLSPGTTVLWDFGYGDSFPDLPFVPAAVLLTRVISKPSSQHITLDLGHKAVASERPHPRVWFPQLEEQPEAIMHSEEHLVLAVERAERYHIGDALIAIPRHICPTVALHGEVLLVREGRIADSWPVTARNRRITF